MREISSERYANEVEDVICAGLEDALRGAFDYITRHLGCIEDYDERQVAAECMVAAFQAGVEATWRDQAVKLFEIYGMDVTSDGRDF